MYTYSTVQEIINQVSQDARLQLSSQQGTAGQPILIDFCNRIHKQMLRFSRWDFVKSEPQYFITRKGITNYWIGGIGGQPGECVDTALNLSDVDRLDKDSVWDVSNNRPLHPMSSQPFGWNLNTRSGQTRNGLPKTYWQDQNNILRIYPGAINDNPWLPSPDCPILATIPSGSLPQRTYNALLTFVDSLGGESQPSATSVALTINLSCLVTVQSPTLFIQGNDSGVQYGWYNVYLGSGGEGSETLQNSSPIPIGTNWTEPTTGLITTGVNAPTNSTIAQLGGFIIKFQYFKARLVLNNVEQNIQIPDDYEDVLVQGVNALVWKFLGRLDDAQGSAALYKRGLTEMVWDKNQRPGVQYVHPDPATYVNTQILGILPDTNRW